MLRGNGTSIDAEAPGDVPKEPRSARQQVRAFWSEISNSVPICDPRRQRSAECFQSTEREQITGNRNDEVVAVKQKCSIQRADIRPGIEEHVINLQGIGNAADEFTNGGCPPKSLGLSLQALRPKFRQISFEL